MDIFLIYVRIDELLEFVYQKFVTNSMFTTTDLPGLMLLT